MDKYYWSEFYKNGQVPVDCSTFAASIVNLIPKDNVLLELGCGNGRDAFFFAYHGIRVIATDLYDTVSDIKGLDNLKFVRADFTRLPSPFYESTFDVVYSRFTFHSIRSEDASRTIRWVYENLRPGGIFFIEARSVRDPLCGQGTPVESERDAWYTTHYRRFIRREELVKELEQVGFIVEYDLEDNNLAVYKDENPVVIRIHARKPQ